MSEQILPRLPSAQRAIRWLQARHRFGEDCGHIAVPDTGLPRLREMAGELVGSNDLVAIYIPGGAAKARESGEKLDRLVGTVQLLSMPFRLVRARLSMP